MINPLKWTYEDRVELLVAAIAGAVLGIVAGYSDGSRGLSIVVWALLFAVVVSGSVYYLRPLTAGFAV